MLEIVLCHAAAVETKRHPRRTAALLSRLCMASVKALVIAIFALVFMGSGSADSAPSPDDLLKSVVTIETDAGSGSGVMFKIFSNMLPPNG